MTSRQGWARLREGMAWVDSDSRLGQNADEARRGRSRLDVAMSVRVDSGHGTTRLEQGQSYVLASAGDVEGQSEWGGA
jgi:hypothetical protein